MSAERDTPPVTKGGTVLTDEEAERLAEEAEAGYDLTQARRVGRPALGETKPSPQVTFRAPAELRAKAEERAAREGKTVSQLAREAFEHYLAS